MPLYFVEPIGPGDEIHIECIGYKETPTISGTPITDDPPEAGYENEPDEVSMGTIGLGQLSLIRIQ